MIISRETRVTTCLPHFWKVAYHDWFHTLITCLVPLITQHREELRRKLEEDRRERRRKLGLPEELTEEEKAKEADKARQRAEAEVKRHVFVKPVSGECGWVCSGCRGVGGGVCCVCGVGGGGGGAVQVQCVDHVLARGVMSVGMVVDEVRWGGGA